MVEDGGQTPLGGDSQSTEGDFVSGRSHEEFHK